MTPRILAPAVVIILLLTSLCLLPGSARPAPVVLKFATVAPKRSIWGKAVVNVSTKLEEATQGQVKLKLFADGIQGQERTVLRKMRAGRVHGAGFLSQGLMDVCPDSTLLHLPLMFSDHDEAHHVLTALRGKLEEQCRKQGFEAIAWPQFGFSYLFSRDEVASVAKLAAGKPWLVEDDAMMRATYEALGVTPVSAGVSDVLASLQSGLIRTIFAPPSAVIALQWHTRLEYRLSLRINYSIGVILFSSKAWNKLSEEHQQLIRDLWAEQVETVNERTRTQNSEALEVLATKGLATIEADPASLKRFNEVTTVVAEKMSAEHFSADLFTQAQKILAQYREKQSQQ